jgi:hypothetical protein
MGSQTVSKTAAFTAGRQVHKNLAEKGQHHVLQ